MALHDIPNVSLSAVNRPGEKHVRAQRRQLIGKLAQEGFSINDGGQRGDGWGGLVAGWLSRRQVLTN
jgi:hypothetical protein